MCVARRALHYWGDLCFRLTQGDHHLGAELSSHEDRRALSSACAAKTGSWS